MLRAALATLLLFTAALVALTVSVVWLMRHRATQWSPPETSARLARETRTLFQDAPFARADDHGALVSAFEDADFYDSADYDENGAPVDRAGADNDNGADLTPEQLRSALDTIAELIEARASASADHYAQWMRSRGYTLRTKAELQFDHPAFAGRFRLLTGRDLTPEDTPWTTFRDTFEGELAHHRAGDTRPAGVFIAPGAVEIWVGTIRDSPSNLSFGILDPFLPVFYARLQQNTDVDDVAGRLHWADGEDYAGWPFWAPPVTYDDILDRDAEVLTLRIHCIVRTTKGGVLPLMFVIYYDPATHVWHIPDNREAFAYADTYAVSLHLSPAF